MSTPTAKVIVVTASGERIAVPLTGDAAFDRRLMSFAVRGGELLDPALGQRDLGEAA